jgi:hypothetical protein
VLGTPFYFFNRQDPASWGLTLLLMLGPWNKDKNQSISAADIYSPARLKQNLSEKHPVVDAGRR